jgi:hypothetical protein
MKKKFLAKYPKLREDIKEILQAARFEPSTGWSEKFELTPEIKEKYLGNGDTLTRRGTVLRKYFILRSYYGNGVERIDDPSFGHRFERDGKPTQDKQSLGKCAIRLEGYSKYTASKAAVPHGMREKMIAAGIPERCAWSSSTSSIQVDHPEGRPQKNGFTRSNSPFDYQFLTEHNNQVKRNICQNCIETNKRFNPKELLGMPIDFIEGGEDFDIDGPGCRGCMLHNFRAFYAAMAPKS